MKHLELINFNGDHKADTNSRGSPIYWTWNLLLQREKRLRQAVKYYNQDAGKLLQEMGHPNKCGHVSCFRFCEMVFDN